MYKMRVAELRELLKVARKETMQPISKMKQAELIQEGIERGIMPSKKTAEINEIKEVVEKKEAKKAIKKAPALVESDNDETAPPPVKAKKGRPPVPKVEPETPRVKKAPNGFAKFVSENKGKGMTLKEMASKYKENKAQ
jgi:hypothetical protein